MPFYEMLPGGMPAGLQSDMDAVLNKKWGTSTTYPPEDWPETVNLMGPLPERTLSGSVVAFADGADTVPLKKCEVTIPANLAGVSSVKVVHSGENLFDVSTVIAGNLNVNTGNVDTSQSASWRASDFILAKEGDYCLSWESPQSSYYQGKWCAYDENYARLEGASMTAYSTYSKSFTAPAGTKFLRVGWAITASGNPAPKENIRLNAGNADLGYTAYKAPTTNTAALGRTVYGGTADVVNGTGTDIYLYALLNDPTKWKTYSSSTLDFYYDVQFTDRKLYEDSYTGVICSAYPTTRTAGTTYARWNSASGYYFGIRSEDSSVTLSDIQTMASAGQIAIVYEKATAEAFAFDPVPIDSRYGDNTIWSDNGDIEVAYRRDIALALAQ